MWCGWWAGEAADGPPPPPTYPIPARRLSVASLSSLASALGIEVGLILWFRMALVGGAEDPALSPEFEDDLLELVGDELGDLLCW